MLIVAIYFFFELAEPVCDSTLDNKGSVNPTG
jgi:hypothetical protein